MACLSGRVLLRGLITGLSALWLLLAGGSAGVDPRLLTWKPPALTVPTTLTVSAQTPSPQGLQLQLDPGRDYIIELDTLTGPGGLSLRGGRKDTKKRLGRSPDRADAVLMAFAVEGETTSAEVGYMPTALERSDASAPSDGPFPYDSVF